MKEIFAKKIKVVFAKINFSSEKIFHPLLLINTWFSVGISISNAFSMVDMAQTEKISIESQYWGILQKQMVGSNMPNSSAQGIYGGMLTKQNAAINELIKHIKNFEESGSEDRRVMFDTLGSLGTLVPFK